MNNKYVFIGMMGFFQLAFGAVLEIENKSRFICEVQPVVDDKDRKNMDAFKYTIRPNSPAVSYQSGFHSIKALRWRINNYFDNNTKLSRNYFFAEIPGGIGVTNINAKIVIMPNGDFRYYKNKKNESSYIEFTPHHLKYIYQNTSLRWIPLHGVVNNKEFDFDIEMSNDMYR